MIKKIVLIFTVLAVFSVGIFLGTRVLNSKKATEQLAERMASYRVTADISIEPTEEVRNFEVRSEIIPELKPHWHGPGDSAYDPDHHLIVDFPIFMVTEDSWLTGIDIDVNNAPKEIIHHLLPFSKAFPGIVCLEEYSGIPVFGFGYDSIHESIKLPEPYAIFVPAGSLFLIDAMVHNPKPPVGPGGDYANVRVSANFKIQKVNDRNDKKIVKPFVLYLSDQFCRPNIYEYIFEVPPLIKNFTKKTDQTEYGDSSFYQFKESGEIIYAYGHLHGWDGGKKIEIFKNDEMVDTLKTFRFDSEDKPWLWETERSDKKIWVEKGDVISIAATYSNPYSAPIRGAMADYFFFFLPD